MTSSTSDDNSVLLVHAYLDGELDPANALEIEQRMSTDPALAAEGERVKALTQKRKAQNDQKILANQVLSDVDKALAAFEIQKKRVELYRTGVLAKIDDILNLTEFSLKAGEGSSLDLLDAIRTRRETLRHRRCQNDRPEGIADVIHPDAGVLIGGEDQPRALE